MNIKASEIKQLREKTGAGMLDCKNALVKAEGDAAQAEKILKEQGLAAAAKRSDRVTSEGRIFTCIESDKAGILELSCETDFVARNDDFIALGNALLEKIIKENIAEITDELVGMVTEAISRIKENITLKRFKVIDIAKNELAVDYLHGEGNIGVIVKVMAEDPAALEKPEVKDLAFDLALHIAAYNPVYLNRDKVDTQYLTDQEAIFTKQAENLGKPEKVLQGIVKAKLNKHLSEICLLDQGFVKEEKKSVATIVSEAGKDAGTPLSITDYLYFRVGESV